MRTKIERDFFKDSTTKVAQALLGMIITTKIRDKTTAGLIVEVEAYHGNNDAASHSYSGKTKRNEIMFQDGGLCYVYLIYGMHYCVNVVTESHGIGAAVLIRAIEPISGIDTMLKRRNLKVSTAGKTPFSLCNGPGKLCKALGIDRSFLGEDFLTSKKISLATHSKFSKREVSSSTRIGISKATDLEWRFFVKDNPWVSKH